MNAPEQTEPVRAMTVWTFWALSAVTVVLDLCLIASAKPVRVRPAFPAWHSWCKYLHSVNYFYLFFLDNDECRSYPGRLCAQKCNNTPGLYRCSCHPGFKLASDGKSCEGGFVINQHRCCWKKFTVLVWTEFDSSFRCQWMREQPMQPGVCECLWLLPVLLSPWLPAQQHGWIYMWR